MTEQPQSNKQEQAEQAAGKLNEFLKANGLKLVPGLSFPNYNKIPVELELAITVIKKHEPSFDIEVLVEEPAQPLSTPPTK